MLNCVVMNYGELPPLEVIEKAWNNGFPITVKTNHDLDMIKAAVNQGIDSHLEAVFCDTKEGEGEVSITIKDAKSMHTFLRRLIETEGESELDMANCILAFFGVEWI